MVEPFTCPIPEKGVISDPVKLRSVGTYISGAPAYPWIASTAPCPSAAIPKVLSANPLLMYGIKAEGSLKYVSSLSIRMTL